MTVADLRALGAMLRRNKVRSDLLRQTRDDRRSPDVFGFALAPHRQKAR